MGRCTSVLLALVILTPLAVYADNWPQWRGPTNDGICKETKLPAEWSETKNVLWKMAMPGMGSSTPAIWGDRLLLTSVEGNDTVLVCIDVASEGKQVWKAKLGAATRTEAAYRAGALR